MGGGKLAPGRQCESSTDAGAPETDAGTLVCGVTAPVSGATATVWGYKKKKKKGKTGRGTSPFLNCKKRTSGDGLGQRAWVVVGRG